MQRRSRKIRADDVIELLSSSQENSAGDSSNNESDSESDVESASQSRMDRRSTVRQTRQERAKVSGKQRHVSESAEESADSEDGVEDSKFSKVDIIPRLQRPTTKKQNVKKSAREEVVEVSDEDSESDSPIQVPDSSPHRNPRNVHSMELDSSPIGKPTTRLTSLRETFSYNPKKESPKPSISSDYRELKRTFPDIPATTIMSALKSEKTLRDAMRYLRKLEPSFRSKSSNSIKSQRLASLSDANKRGRLILSSPVRADVPISNRKGLPKLRDARLERESRLREKARLIEEKKSKQIEYERALARQRAERESIKSSKVQLDNTKKSLRAQYVGNRLSKHRNTKTLKGETSEEEEEKEGHDDDDRSDESLVELVESDDSHDEVAPPNRRGSKRRYEDDDDYDPYSRPRTGIGRQDRQQKRRQVVEYNDEFNLPEFMADEDKYLNIDQKIIKLFNNADVRDIIDLSNMTPEQATVYVQNRPYTSISSILKVDVSMGRKLSKFAKSPNERHIELIGEKLTAYSAIDTLLKQCFDYSKSITSEIRKWGVNLKGKNLNGELAITNVDIATDESDEENGGDDSGSASDNIDQDDDDVVVIKKKYKKFKLDGSEHDDDFGTSGFRPRYKSNIDNSKVPDKIGYFKRKPVLLSDEISLKDYQQVGINWIHLLFQKGLSCILADEMGLGKTAQVIAFLSHLKKKKYRGPHLIVVPSSTLENWLREFEKFSPTLKVIPYYGSLDEREELRSVLYEDDDYDVVITTYNLTVGKIDGPFLQTLNFNVIVYDEGHMLKNATSDRYKKLTKLRANFRLLLTGTPLQNNLKELVSLLDFILPEVFGSKMSKLQLLFDKRASTKVENEQIQGKNYNPLMSEQAISKAKVMMSPFVLRRTKAQVMTELPKKHTAIEYCELVPAQVKIYQEELDEVNTYRIERDRRKLLSDEELKKLPHLAKKNVNMLMALRKACMHPLLFRRLYTDKMLKLMARLIMKNEDYMDANETYIFEDMQVMSDFELSQLCHQYPNELGKFVLKQQVYSNSGKTKVLVDMLSKIIEKGEKVLVFSLFTQMLDILEKVLSLHGWKFLRLDGATAVDSRQTIIDTFYEDKTIPVMLLSTKAGGFGINLVCATNVIIYDQSLNPHDDKQAEDRAHRVGQTKDVQVTRLVVKNSIEENILHMAFNKLQLDNSIMAQNAEDVLLKTVEDLIAVKKEQKDSKQEGKVITEETDNTDAFESPVTLELAAAEEEEKDEPVEIIVPELKSVKGRTRRNRRSVNYFDGNDPNEFIEKDTNARTDECELVDINSVPNSPISTTEEAKNNRISNMNLQPVFQSISEPISSPSKVTESGEKTKDAEQVGDKVNEKTTANSLSCISSLTKDLVKQIKNEFIVSNLTQNENAPKNTSDYGRMKLPQTGESENIAQSKVEEDSRSNPSGKENSQVIAEKNGDSKHADDEHSNSYKDSLPENNHPISCIKNEASVKVSSNSPSELSKANT